MAPYVGYFRLTKAGTFVKSMWLLVKRTLDPGNELWHMLISFDRDKGGSSLGGKVVLQHPRTLGRILFHETGRLQCQREPGRPRANQRYLPELTGCSLVSRTFSFSPMVNKKVAPERWSPKGGEKGELPEKIQRNCLRRSSLSAPTTLQALVSTTKPGPDGVCSGKEVELGIESEVDLIK